MTAIDDEAFNVLSELENCFDKKHSKKDLAIDVVGRLKMYNIKWTNLDE